MPNLTVPFISAFTAGLTVFGCGSASVFTDVRAVDVTLIPREGAPQPAQAVPPQALGPWQTCLGTTRTIGIDEAYKMVLEEGEYRLDITDTAGPRRFVLHNTSDLTGPGGDFYRNDCVHALVTAFVGATPPTP